MIFIMLSFYFSIHALSKLHFVGIWQAWVEAGARLSLVNSAEKYFLTAYCQMYARESAVLVLEVYLVLQKFSS